MQSGQLRQNYGGAFRLLVSSSIAPDETGNRLPVVASLPRHLDDAAGLAALVEAAAADADVPFVTFLHRIAKAAPPPVGKIGRFAPAHRPSFDWLKEHGSSLSHLWAIAERHCAANPKMTKIGALQTALEEARQISKRRKLSAAALKVEAKRLRLALRRLPAPQQERGNCTPRNSSEFSHNC